MLALDTGTLPNAIMNHNPQYKTDNLKYFCSDCRAHYSSKKEFYLDFLGHSNFYKCEVCQTEETQFKTRSIYVKHMKTKHKTQGKAIQYKLYSIIYGPMYTIVYKLELILK